MRRFDEMIKEKFGIEEAGKETCEKCGETYTLYHTKKGIVGACKPCYDKEFIQSLELPTKDEYRQSKETGIISELERVTSDLKNATVNNYQPKHETQVKAKEIAKNYILNFDKEHSLVLSGNPGLGKTHLAYAIAKGVRKMRDTDGNHYKTMFIKSTDLLQKIRSTYHSESTLTEERILKLIDKVDLLVLDDVGSEYIKKNDDGSETWATDILYKVADMRLGKALVVTTNYNESSLVDKFGNNGPRVVDRLLDNAERHRLEGDSFRKNRF